ncbi:hypothetical protein AMECASPLE_028682 [Ameca splendens]|uniref:Uncharacterized protein n=1 Tax=Ameca splendens TaxID=208324 RepID=A0ABV0YGN6_9TELE
MILNVGLDNFSNFLPSVFSLLMSSHPAVVPAMVTTSHHNGEGDALVPFHQSPTTNLTPQAVEIQLPSVRSRDGVFANFAKGAPTGCANFVMHHCVCNQTGSASNSSILNYQLCR